MKLLTLLLWALPVLVQAQFLYTTNNGSITITGYTGPGGEVIIPGMTNDYLVTSIGDAAFYHCTNLTSVTIPNGVTNIGAVAFYACKNLSRVAIPNTVISIGQDTFTYCGSLTGVSIPASVRKIGVLAFSPCFNLTNLSVDPLNPFYSSVGGVLFNSSQTTLFQCPGGKAGSYMTPNSVTRIEDQAFSYCTRLTNVIITSGVTNIRDSAFQNCYGLRSVYFEGNAPPYRSTGTFQGDTNVTVYYLPGTSGWSTSTYFGVPTALWNPLMQAVSTRDNELGFNITGTANIPIEVESSSDLTSASWTSLLTCTLTNGSIHFSDPAWANFPARFYRIRSP